MSPGPAGAVVVMLQVAETSYPTLGAPQPPAPEHSVSRGVVPCEHLTAENSRGSSWWSLHLDGGSSVPCSERGLGISRVYRGTGCCVTVPVLKERTMVRRHRVQR